MSSLLNKKAVKSLLLAAAKEHKPFHPLTRVSEDVYPKVEAAVRQACINIVKSQPSSGVTIK
jgi:hypothetical protein